MKMFLCTVKTVLTLYLMARICITRTEGEWEAINEGMKNGLSHYIRMECSTLIEDFKDCPLCITPADGEKNRKTI